ncbi:MAG: disulfide bond formation protein B [Pseudomonadales bacterium]
MAAFFEDRTEAMAALIVAVTGGLLGGAIIMEHAFGLDPCPLCLMQRVWFAFAGLISFVALLHSTRWGIYPLLTILAAMVGGGFSIRQLYLQSLPPEAVPACGPDMTYMLENFPLADVLAAMTRGTGDCAAVAWQFGLTIPGWALVGFVGIVVLGVLWLRAGLRA